MTNFKHLIQSTVLLVAAIAVQGCSSSTNDFGRAGSADLRVSVADLYWGTRDVGVETTQLMTLSNQSANVIRINAVSIAGANAIEFSSSMTEAVSLNAGESIDIAVSFVPQSEGRKHASLEIDYDKI